MSSKESEIDKNINKVDGAQSYSQQNEQQSSKAENKEIQKLTQAEQFENRNNWIPIRRLISLQKSPPLIIRKVITNSNLVMTKLLISNQKN